MSGVCFDDCGNHGDGQEGIFFWGSVREGLPLKIKIFPEVSTHSDSQSSNWAKAAYAWSDHISLHLFRVDSLKAFNFPKLPEEINKLFRHFPGFHFCLECFFYPPLLSFLCSPHPTNVLRSVSKIISLGSLHQPTKINHSPLNVTRSSAVISTALANHISKWFSFLSQ